MTLDKALAIIKERDELKARVAALCRQCDELTDALGAWGTQVGSMARQLEAKTAQLDAWREAAEAMVGEYEAWISDDSDQHDHSALELESQTKLEVARALDAEAAKA